MQEFSLDRIKTKTKIITLNLINHSRRRQSNEAIRTQSKYTKSAPSAGNRVQTGGGRYFIQSHCVAVQNQSNREIIFETQFETALHTHKNHMPVQKLYRGLDSVRLCYHRRPIKALLWLRACLSQRLGEKKCLLFVKKLKTESSRSCHFQLYLKLQPSCCITAMISFSLILLTAVHMKLFHMHIAIFLISRI